MKSKAMIVVTALMLFSLTACSAKEQTEIVEPTEAVESIEEPTEVVETIKEQTKVIDRASLEELESRRENKFYYEFKAPYVDMNMHEWDESLTTNESYTKPDMFANVEDAGSAYNGIATNTTGIINIKVVDIKKLINDSINEVVIEVKYGMKTNASSYPLFAELTDKLYAIRTMQVIVHYDNSMHIIPSKTKYDTTYTDGANLVSFKNDSIKMMDAFVSWYNKGTNNLHYEFDSMLAEPYFNELAVQLRQYVDECVSLKDDYNKQF